MNTTIIVSKQTVKKLHGLKHDLELSSINTTILYLINVYAKKKIK